MSFPATGPRLRLRQRHKAKGVAMFTSRKFFEWGGICASVCLVAFGIASIVVGINGRSTVRDSLKQEAIVGRPDMTPTAIKAEAKEAGLNIATIKFPTKAVADKPITTGERARTFAQYMRIHALEATHGCTDNPQFALTDPKTKQPVANGVRDVWVTETALTTALNTSYMAERLALFGVMVGVALLLSGIGFSVLTIGGALRRAEARGSARVSPAQVAPTTSSAATP